jgi:glycosyltransferase involved in cell wall biosynthesis
MNDPLFSVIVATYNRANRITNAVESVLNQDYSKWECLIIDDGSTDDTKAIVDQYVKADKRIKYFYQENSERSAARNNGIKNAKGDFICFLDSDDVYDFDHLSTFLSLIEQKHYKDALYVSGVSFGSRSHEPQVYYTNAETDLDFVLLNTIGTPRACVSKTILNQFNFDSKISIGEDMELWSRISLNFPVFYHTKKTFIEIEHNERSINTNKRFQQLNTIKLIIKNTKPNRNIAKRIISNAYFSIAKYLIKRNNRFKSIVYIVKSIACDISSELTKHKVLLCLSLLKLYKNIYKQYQE